MRYGSVCSGIEAASVAWKNLGWQPQFFSEIDDFPRAVLSHHHPNVPLHGDFTSIRENDYGPIDLLVGGTPCQSFSIAGLRKGMEDERGNLALEYLRLAQRKRPRWLVWENVPGVLSSNGGRDFGAFLGGLVECGYGFAYRVLDAQYFGVAQRRRRVFVVGYFGDWRRAAAVLFERHSLQGHPAPSREARQDTPADIIRSTEVYECHGQDSRVKPLGETCSTVTAKYGTGGGNVPIISTVGFQSTAGADDAAAAGENISPTLRSDRPMAVVHAPDTANCISASPSSNCSPNVASGQGDVIALSGMEQASYVQEGLSVRRLTPIECERLQGFPDRFTQIPYRNKPSEKCPDGPRYKALGNSMAVPVMRWIGERINEVQKL